MIGAVVEGRVFRIRPHIASIDNRNIRRDGEAIDDSVFSAEEVRVRVDRAEIEGARAARRYRLRKEMFVRGESLVRQGQREVVLLRSPGLGVGRGGHKREG